MNYRILFTIENLFELGSVGELKILTETLLTRGWEVHLAILGEHRYLAADPVLVCNAPLHDDWAPTAWAALRPYPFLHPRSDGAMIAS